MPQNWPKKASPSTPPVQDGPRPISAVKADRPVAEGAASIRYVVDLPASGGTSGFYQDGKFLPW
ncbi:hypothetical protein ASE04_18335 [Rhizobium sp. Root708]|nr:hypothetical protein ASE04_18335 [Rhizobium sp. Root708]